MGDLSGTLRGELLYYLVKDFDQTFHICCAAYDRTRPLNLFFNRHRQPPIATYRSRPYPLGHFTPVCLTL